MSLERELPSVRKMMVKGIVGPRGRTVRGERPCGQGMTGGVAAVAFVRREDRENSGAEVALSPPASASLRLLYLLDVVVVP